MHKVDPVYLEHERKRWMRPDAHRFIRPDWRRHVQSGSELHSLFELYEQKYSPEQPRVPAGNPDGGQWTSGGGDSGNASDVGSTTELSAQSRRRGPASSTEPTPGQAARLAVAEAQARAARARVRELDPTWRPTPSLTESVEGQIAAARAEAREGEARLRELSLVGIGPGPFAGECISAGPNITATDRRELNRIGSETGCHTCGTFEPGTYSAIL